MKRTMLLMFVLLLGAAPPKGCEGKAKLFARVPAPAFPEGVAVDRGRVYVSGPATFGTAGQGPSAVWVYGADGRLLQTWSVQGEALQYEHGLSCLAVDGAGRIYVLSTQLGVLRFNRDTGAQSTYAPPFPMLPTTPPYLFPLPNDLAFDADGALFVSDSLQGAIFRIPPGGGAAQVWLQDTRLQTPFGPNTFT